MLSALWGSLIIVDIKGGKMIDNQGKVFGRINIIDLLIVIGMICFLIALPFAWKVMTTKPGPLPPDERIYALRLSCPVCGWVNRLELLKGELPPDFYKTKCFNDTV